MVETAFKLLFTTVAAESLRALQGQKQHAVKLKKVRKALGQLQVDPRYPALNSHKYSSLKGASGEEVWDSYVENNVPSAWRIFWHYGPGSNVITVVNITPHP